MDNNLKQVPERSYTNYCPDRREYALKFAGKYECEINKMRAFLIATYFTKLWVRAHNYVDFNEIYPGHWTSSDANGKRINFLTGRYDISLQFNADIIDEEDEYENVLQYIALITNHENGDFMTLIIEKFESDIWGSIHSYHSEEEGKRFVDEIVLKTINDEIVDDTIMS